MKLRHKVECFLPRGTRHGGWDCVKTLYFWRWRAAREFSHWWLNLHGIRKTVTTPRRWR